MLGRWLGVASAAAGIALAGAAFAQATDAVPVPALRARVTDLTGTLAQAQLQNLEGRLQEFERRKGSQIAVLMLSSTRPETIEQYSIRVAEAWKVGRARVDDGVILVIAKSDQRLRIEVGRGLEGAIPDVVAKRVIREVIAPHFLNGDFNGGVADGVGALIKLIDGEPLPPPKAQSSPGESSGDYESAFVVVLVLALVAGSILSKLFGRLAGSSLVGAIAGAATWLIAGTLVVGIIAAIVGFLFTLWLGSSANRLTGSGGYGGWGGGGFSSGGGGGGFSGGGGDFGGGGASGSWGN